ncbi:hypothetical protein QL285_089872 [Trifolium repens]|nr:hypothetical protein QL285_089872 [Trifolium repens]
MFLDLVLAVLAEVVVWLRLWCWTVGVLALVSCPVTPEKARTLGVAEGCSSLLRLAGLWYLVEFFCIRC